MTRSMSLHSLRRIAIGMAAAGVLIAEVWAPSMARAADPPDWSSLTAPELAVELPGAAFSLVPRALRTAVDEAWPTLSDATAMRALAFPTLRDTVALIVGATDDPQRRLTLGGHVLAVVEADRSLIEQDTFALALRTLRALRAAGVDGATVVGFAAGWMGANDWENLNTADLESLWRELQADTSAPEACSVRWTGTVQAPVSGVYTFSRLGVSNGFDRMRVWVDGALVMDVDEHGVGDRDSDPVALTATTPVTLRVDYSFRQDDDPCCTWSPAAMLLWSSAALTEQIVPVSALRTPSGAERGLEGVYYTTSDFTGDSCTHIDSTIDFVWEDRDVIPGAPTEQAAVLAELATRLVGADAATIAGSGAVTALSTPAKRALISGLQAGAGSIDPFFIDGVYRKLKHADEAGDLLVPALAAWSTAHPPETVFGVNGAAFRFANYALAESIGAQMISAFRGHADALIEDGLVSESGGCDRMAACLLSFAAQDGGWATSWKATLDAKLADQSITGDARASWLLARAFAEEACRGTPHPIVGRRWLDEAIGAATTDAMLTDVVGVLASRLASIERCDDADALIDTFESQMGQPTADAMRAKVAQVRTDIGAFYQQQRAEAKAAFRAEVERRLAEANASNNARMIAKCEAALQRLDAE